MARLLENVYTGFVGFVASLNRNTLRRQFGLFCWIHMSLFLILGSRCARATFLQGSTVAEDVAHSHFIVNNILEGLIWLWLPASVVIMNDVAAYVCGALRSSALSSALIIVRRTGMAFGRHQLIKLSPKKTVEGFVGAIFATLVFAYVVRRASNCRLRSPGAVGDDLHALQLYDLPRARAWRHCSVPHHLRD